MRVCGLHWRKVHAGCAGGGAAQVWWVPGGVHVLCSGTQQAVVGEHTAAGWSKPGHVGVQQAAVGVTVAVAVAGQW